MAPAAAGGGARVGGRDAAQAEVRVRARASLADTLFALGCGRLFEGSPQQMWASLSQLTPLPDDTLVYCAYEYTQSNARWVYMCVWGGVPCMIN